MTNVAALLLLTVILPAHCLRFRRGVFGDLVPIATTMAKNLMNPLSIKVDCFEVVESNGERIGWGQLRPLGPAAVAADEFDAAPGSRGAEDVDAAWDALPEFPTGFASLPWTDEYKAFARGADDRRNARNAATADEPQLWELASVFVLEDHRGCGTGAAIVRRLLERHVERGLSAADIYLLTLASTASWYEGLGFEPVTEPRDVPQPLAFEVAAGRVVTGLMGAELVVMRGVGDPGT
jgi:N-acetylglutamate synthase-like GNAT family acetyltransferase